MASEFDFLKDTDAVLDYTWDWTDWLAESETISTSTFTASTGITIDSDSIAASGKAATVWLSGGTAGFPYSVANKITTNESRTDERTVIIRVTNR